MMSRRSTLLSLLLACFIAACLDPSAHAQDIPETPSRQAIVDAMNSVSPAVRRCGPGDGSAVQVRIVFEGPRGTVKSVQAQAFAANLPPAVSACVERAVQQARVPPFRRSDFSVNYPFRF